MNNVREMMLHRAHGAVYLATYHRQSKGPKRVANTKGRRLAQSYGTFVREETHLATLDRAWRTSIDQLMKQGVGAKVARTAPPTSYNNQFML